VITPRRLAVLAGLLVVACFRYESLWSGVEMFDRGERVRLAADAGLCGCVTLANRTDAAVLLHARLDGALIGSTRLRPKERITARFDWAGDTVSHAYVVEAFGNDGRRVRLADVVEVGEHSSWRACETSGCEWGPLSMRVAATDRYR
jgi:hypothetical protein